MTTTNITSSSYRHFSWKRVGGMMKYFSLLIRQQITLYLGISLIFAILLLLPLESLGKMGIYTIVWFIIPFMVQLAPCALGKLGYTGSIERLIPVKASEKMFFYLLYFLVIVPLSCYLLPCLAELIYLHIPSLQDDIMTNLVKIQFGGPYPILIFNTVGSIASILTCLYVVNRVRFNKVLLGIVAVVICHVVEGIFGAIIGGLGAFRAGFEDGFNNRPQLYETSVSDNINLIITNAFESVKGVFWIGIGIMVAYVIVMLILNYRHLRESNY